MAAAAQAAQTAKDALLAQQQSALDLSARAMQIIDSVTGLANFWLQALSILIAVIAFIGLTAVIIETRRMAAKVADKRLTTYLSGSEVLTQIRQAVADEVRTQVERKAFIMVQPSTDDEEDGDEGSFPTAPNKKGVTA